MTNTEKTVIELLLRHGEMSITDLVALSGIKRNTLNSAAYALKHMGQIHVCGNGRMPGGHGGHNIWAIGCAKPGLAAARDPKLPGESRNIKRRKGSWYEIPRATNWGGYLESSQG